MKINKKIEQKIKAGIRKLDPEPIYQIETILMEFREKGHSRIWEDYSNYESGSSSDGGKYGFWTNAHLKRDKKGYYLELEERTTCDAFPYCPSCGSFNSHDNKCMPVRISI